MHYWGFIIILTNISLCLGSLEAGELWIGCLRALEGPCGGRKEKVLSRVASADEDTSEEVICLS